MALLALIYGLSAGIPLTPDARITVFDVISIFVLVRYTGVAIRDVYLRRMAIFLAIYIAALIASTQINGTPLESLARRGGSAVMLYLETAAIYVFLMRVTLRDQGVLLVAMMISSSFYLFYPLDARIPDAPLKFLLATPITVLIGGIFFIIKLPRFAATLAISSVSMAFAIVFFTQGDRSPGGILVAFSFLVWISLPEDRLRQLKFRPWLLVKYFLVMAVAAYGLTELYTYAALAGYFGETAAGIAEFQSQFFGSILLGGRPEILANLVAMYESPFVGWGPLAEDVPHQLLLVSLGIYGEDWLEGDGSLYHSMIFGAGHEAGVTAPLFWIALLYWCFKACLMSLSSRRKYKYFLPLWLNAIWNLLLSPLISLNRPQIAAAVAFSFIVFVLPEFQRHATSSLASLNHRATAR
jgi:hypothetical protein